MFPSEVFVVAQTNVIKYMLSKPIMRGRQDKWLLALIEYCFKYVPQKVVKGQTLVDFLAKHPCSSINEDLFEINCIENTPCRLMFDALELRKGLELVLCLLPLMSKYINFLTS